MSLEVISPELVLVDPELARAERARLVERARLTEYLQQAPATTAPVTAPPESPRKSLLPPWIPWQLSQRRQIAYEGMFLLALLANGVGLAFYLTGGTESSQSFAAPAPAITAPAPPPSRKVLSERRVLSALLGAPAETKRLPASFVDPTTGLIRNNVRVACRRTQAARYRCTVRRPGDARRLALMVRYTADGGSVLRWPKR
jgi:hypothetical protein